jgi:hypothetical protein
LFENCQKSQYSQGWDTKLKEPATIEIMEIAKDAIIAGYKKNTLAKMMCQELDMPYAQAQAFAGKCWKQVMQIGKDRTEGMKEKNIQRLEFLYAKCVDQNDMKNALSALDQLNKLTQLYKTNVELSTDQFEFVIGE